VSDQLHEWDISGTARRGPGEVEWAAFGWIRGARWLKTLAMARGAIRRQAGIDNLAHFDPVMNEHSCG